MRKRIGEHLIQAGVISNYDLRTALDEQLRSGECLGAVLVRLNFATERQVARAFAHQLGLGYTNFQDSAPDPAAVALMPREVAMRRVSIGVRVEDDLLTTAMIDPGVFGLVQDLESRTGHRIRPVIATRTDILGAIQAGYSAITRVKTVAASPDATDCRKCRRRLESEWRFCPFCAAAVAMHCRPRRLPDAAAI